LLPEKVVEEYAERPRGSMKLVRVNHTKLARKFAT
jgi:hypothetical protein